MCVVGITCNSVVEDGVEKEWIKNKYIDALTEFSNVDVVLLPTLKNEKDMTNIFQLIDGLVLTGDESNLDPGLLRTGSVITEREGRRDYRRDRLSSLAMNLARSLQMPILGICRGMQEINVFFGGELIENINDDPAYMSHTEDLALERDEQYNPIHYVELSNNGLLHNLLGRSRLKVNSLHNQGVFLPGEQLRKEAVSQDGLVEALSSRDPMHYILGVQWHPEWHVHNEKDSQAIFSDFGKACHSYNLKKKTGV